MEHPMFSLLKTPDLKIRVYEHKGNSITITPSAAGLATIWNKDILLFTIRAWLRRSIVDCPSAVRFGCAPAIC